MSECCFSTGSPGLSSIKTTKQVVVVADAAAQLWLLLYVSIGC